MGVRMSAVLIRKDGRTAGVHAGKQVYDIDYYNEKVIVEHGYDDEKYISDEVENFFDGCDKVAVFKDRSHPASDADALLIVDRDFGECEYDSSHFPEWFFKLPFKRKWEEEDGSFTIEIPAELGQYGDCFNLTFEK